MNWELVRLERFETLAAEILKRSSFLCVGYDNLFYLISV